MAKSTPIFRQKKIDRTVAVDSTGASEYTQYRPFAYFEPKLKNRFKKALKGFIKALKVALKRLGDLKRRSLRKKLCQSSKVLP